MPERLKDVDLRTAALSRLFAHAQQCANTLVLEELGLAHGTSRVDIAVINGHIRGVEIKAEADSLERLPRQLQAYGLVVDRATLIASERHLPAAFELLPAWWGVIAARRAANGSIVFRRLRDERANRETDSVSLARLLWRDEVYAVLSEMGCESKLLREPRAALYAELARRMHKAQLSALVRTTLKGRTSWRDRPRPS
jgi:hypothetical protein